MLTIVTSAISAEMAAARCRRTMARNVKSTKVVADSSAGEQAELFVLPPKVLILTIYGAFVRQMGNWLAVADLIALMAELGFGEQVVRSAASRMKKAGLLEARTLERAPGYALTPAALELLADGDARIFHAEIPADPAEGWVLVAFSVPEQHRDQRHVLRSRLVWLGFGQVAYGVWVAPRRVLPELRRMLERTGLVVYATLWEARYLGDAHDLVRDAWDLDELERSYEDFLERCRPMTEAWRRPAQRTDREAFVDYVRMLSAWRRLPYMDPGLPLDLLPEGWSGQRARELFAALDQRLKDRALQHVLAVARRRFAATGRAGSK